jgi:sugar/nucleoside kinase (ribokinase family)
MTSRRRVQVFGPAYLDRVLLVDRPLAGPGEPPLDQSVDGAWTFGAGLVFRDPHGSTLVVEPPTDWPGPCGTVALSTRLGDWPAGRTLSTRGLFWHDDLGGMGAGYASALGGVLVSALGSEDDPMSEAISAALRRAGVRHSPARVEGKTADWTLLVTSGPHGDKLPVGFRGCHAALGSLDAAAEPCDLRVVSAFPNPMAAQTLRASGASVRFFAPAMRNMIDQELPVSRFAEWIDILCCNRREWESLEDREQVAWLVSILAVTDGPNGSLVRYTTPAGEAGRIEVPPFPRSSPPRDTNRAGEAFASTLVTTLLDGGWSVGNGVEESLVRLAGARASAAAALVLDRAQFGFPTPDEIDAALRAGRVEGAPGAAEDDPRYNAGGDGGPA